MKPLVTLTWPQMIARKCRPYLTILEFLPLLVNYRKLTDVFKITLILGKIADKWYNNKVITCQSAKKSKRIMCGKPCHIGGGSQKKS
jgi:hypothetical protein